MEWLTGPLPDNKKLVTLGVVEPFTVSVKVSLIAAIAITLPVILWQVWAFLAPAVEPHFQRVVLGLRRARDGVVRARRPVHVLHRVASRARLPHVVRRQHLRHPNSGELLLQLRGAHAARRRARLPHANLRPRARATTRPDDSADAKQPEHRVRAAARRSRSSCPPSIRSRSRSRRFHSSSCTRDRSGSRSSWSAAGIGAGTTIRPKRAT